MKKKKVILPIQVRFRAQCKHCGKTISLQKHKDRQYCSRQCARINRFYKDTKLFAATFGKRSDSEAKQWRTLKTR